MLIYLTYFGGKRCEIEVEGSTTIDELYQIAFDKFDIDADPITAARSTGDGLALIFAGKRLRTRFLHDMAQENGISEQMLTDFYGHAPRNLCDYNI